jgi:Mrp family chromosome partitioning ATPase/capsular polysaccharide biosynthesis protein
MSKHTAAEGSPSATFVHYLHVLQRRMWIFLVPVILAPVVAFVVSVGQPSKYLATTSVLLNNLNLAESLNGLPTDQSFNSQPDRAVATQATVARSPDVARRAIKAAHAALTPDDLLSSSSVAPENNANLLDFHVTNHDPRLAVALANAYAKAFSQYSNQLESGPVQTAFNEVTNRLIQLRKTHQQTSPLYADLLDKQQRLVALQTLQTSNAVVVRSAADAAKVAPRPNRSALLGLALGLVVALALVFVVEAVDPRVRDESEIEAALGVPLLARIPAADASRKLADRADRALSPLQYGGRLQAEAFRMLRTNLAFVALNRELKVLLVTSPRPGDGKTTTSANLAMAFARGGQSVVLCDLDAHNPALSEAMAVPRGKVGVTDIVLGRTTVEEALTPISIEAADDGARFSSYGTPSKAAKGAARNAGRLDVLGFGTLRPPDPGEFVATDAVRDLLLDLRSKFDLVVIDSAPVLSVGDALALSPHVDGSLLIIRATSAARGDLAELARLLARAQTTPVGFVLTDARSRVAAYGYGYGYGGALTDPIQRDPLANVAET